MTPCNVDIVLSRILVSLLLFGVEMGRQVREKKQRYGLVPGPSASMTWRAERRRINPTSRMLHLHTPQTSLARCRTAGNGGTKILRHNG